MELTKTDTETSAQKCKPKNIFSSKIVSRIFCCSKIIEIDAVPIKTNYFQRYAPYNISLRTSKKIIRAPTQSLPVTGMAKFRKSQKMKDTLSAKNLNLRRRSLAAAEQKRIEAKQEIEAKQIMSQILDGQRPGKVTYKIDRSRSQPILRIKHYLVYYL